MRVLIYSPSVDGHRQIYCRVMAEVLLRAGCDVTIAFASRTRGVRVPAPHLQPLREREGVRFVDTCDMPAGGLDVDHAGFSTLLEQVRPDATILAEADNHLSLLVSQLLPGRHRFSCRVAGVFLRNTNYVHMGRLREPLRDRLGRYRRGWFRWNKDSYLFHERLQPRFRLVDVALCLDEAFVAAHPRTHAWLPDIYTPHILDEDAARTEAALHPELIEFLSANQDRRPLVYFGQAQPRRGYDWLLRLAVEEDYAFIHLGTIDDAVPYDHDVVSLRQALVARRAIFETGSYEQSFDVATALFRAASFVALPYRKHYGSSGMMLQALDAGTRVVVPDEGLMGWRVTNFGLGRTYVPGSWADFKHVCRAGVATGRAQQGSLVDYLAWFGREQVTDAIEHAAGLRGEGAHVPDPAAQAVTRTLAWRREASGRRETATG